MMGAVTQAEQESMCISPTLRPVGVVGMGMAVPDRVVTNKDLEQRVDTSDEWIRARTGIAERRIVGPGQTTADLACEAGRQAVENSPVSIDAIDGIIVATVTPDMPFPATACLVQERLGAPTGLAFDLEAACSGFVYGLAVAQQFIATGMLDHVLLIGAESLSTIIDWEDRSTCVLFGDGAGAAVIGPVSAQSGVRSTVLGADGSGSDLLKVPAGGSLKPASQETVAQREHFIRMQGPEVFKFAVQAMADGAKRAVKQAGLELSDIDYMIPHQANSRIISASARRLNIPMDRVAVNIERYGNTSSATIPIALYEAVQAGQIKPGDDLLLIAFGGGVTWAGAVLTWSGGEQTQATRP